MTASTALFDRLRNGRPEWRPWLAVVEAVLGETAASKWDAAVPEVDSGRQPPDPLLANRTISIQASSVRRLLHRAIRIASSSGTEKMATLQPVTRADLDIPGLFAAALCQDDGPVAAVATAAGADPQALQAVVSLLPMPLLHACRRRWTASAQGSWMQGYCPICGSWPAFVEVRGIERNRYFRCGRCGSEWPSRLLHCPYCASADHDELVTLVPEDGAGQSAIEACRRCRGYMKVFTRLQGCAPAAVVLEDLASVHLDVATVTAGYSRPAGPGARLEISVVDNGAARGLFAWNA